MIAEILPFIGLIGVGYYIWQKFRMKATAPEAIVKPSDPVRQAPPPASSPEPVVEPMVEPDARLMTFAELLGWSKDDPELFKRMFPLTLPKQVRERFEGVSDEK